MISLCDQRLHFLGPKLPTIKLKPRLGDPAWKGEVARSNEIHSTNCFPIQNFIYNYIYELRAQKGIQTTPRGQTHIEKVCSTVSFHWTHRIDSESSFGQGSNWNGRFKTYPTTGNFQNSFHLAADTWRLGLGIINKVWSRFGGKLPTLRVSPNFQAHNLGTKKQQNNNSYI